MWNFCADFFVFVYDRILTLDSWFFHFTNPVEKYLLIDFSNSIKVIVEVFFGVRRDLLVRYFIKVLGMRVPVLTRYEKLRLFLVFKKTRFLRNYDMSLIRSAFSVGLYVTKSNGVQAPALQVESLDADFWKFQNTVVTNRNPSPPW